MAYGQKGETGLAIENFTRAIELKPDYAKAYTYRGITLLHLQKWEIFKSDLIEARNVGVDVASGFRSAFGSVENFEQVTGIQLPADIAEMLTQ